MEGTALIVTPQPIAPEENTYPVSSSEDLINPANQPSDSPKLEPLPLPASLNPPFFNDIAGLKGLSAALSAFLERYDDLRNHVESIKAAISAIMPPEAPLISPASPTSLQEKEIIEEIVPEKQQEDENSSNSELDSLCSTMCSRGVRKYIVTHLNNLQMLREEVPKALWQAQNPSKLVLECLGKFFLQGSKAFTRDSPMIPAREASILILECFLLMMGLNVASEQYNGVLDIEKAVKEEADTAAVAWRKRLITEGGLSKANQIDARGLLLFVACFGIPNLFKVEDIRDLAIAGNAKEIVGVLQKSPAFISKISEMVEEMMKKKKDVDAVDIIYTFGLEEKFNARIILISFLREAKETWKKPKKGSPGFTTILYEANKKQLAALKSISKCLQRHGVDPAKLLPGWQINDKIVTLVKEITDFERKSRDRAAQKRKASETEASKRLKLHEAKRQHHGPQHHYARNLPESGLRELVNSYGAPAVVYGGPGAGLLPESMVPPGVVAPPSHSGIIPPYAVHEGVLVDAAGQVINHAPHHPYTWHSDPSIHERYTYTTQQPPPVGLTALYRGASTSVEGYPANPTSTVDLANQGSASDMYQFADSVKDPTTDPRSIAAGGGGGGYASGSGYSAVPTHVSSYLYQP